MNKRLQTGAVLPEERATTETDGEKIIKPAILVHAGSFESLDGPIEFDEERLKRIVSNQNRIFHELQKAHGGPEKTPLGAYPPILDSHESDSTDRVIGRLAAPFYFDKKDIPKVGKAVPCVLTDITFLGKVNVERAKDGRIYHLSIGIDENTDTLSEVSSVITPAAPGASLLARGNKTGTKKLKGDEKMAKVNLKRLQAVASAKAALASAKEDLGRINKLVTESKATSKLAIKKAKVITRLGALVKEGKMTPAELKKQDIIRLAKLDDESLSTCLEAYNSREKPVIDPKQHGTTDAVDFAQIGKKLEATQHKRLKLEAKADIARMRGKRLSEKEEAELSEAKDEEKEHKENMKKAKKMADPEKSGDSESDESHKMWGEHLKHAADAHEAKDYEKLGKHLEAMKAMHEGGAKHLAIPDAPMHSDEVQKQLDGMQEQIDSLQMVSQKLAGELGKVVDAEVEEGHTGLAGEDEGTQEIEEKK